MASAGSPANLTIGGDRSAPVRRVIGGARFHDLLAEAGNNNILGEMMRSLRDRTSLMFVSVTGEKAAQSWLEHEQIIQKVIAGDEQMAELLAARHVFHAGQRYLRNTECGQCARGFPEARRPQGCANVADAAGRARALADGTGSYEIGTRQSRATVRNRGRKQGAVRALLRSE